MTNPPPTGRPSAGRLRSVRTRSAHGPYTEDLWPDLAYATGRSRSYLRYDMISLLRGIALEPHRTRSSE